MVRAGVGTDTGMVRGDMGAGVGVVHGATGGGEEAERGVARAYHDQAGRVGIHGDLGAGFAQYLLHDVASDLASGVHAERLPERSPQTLLAAVLVLTLILVQLAWALDVPLPKNRDMTLTAFEFINEHSEHLSVNQMTYILKTAQWLDNIHDWRDDNRAWDLVIHSIGICLITWLLWRKSPRIGQGEWIVDSGVMVEGYNFAEIMTVIAYILCQMQMLSMLTMICFRKLPFDHIQGFSLLPELILFAILLIDFKQLFQRKWWATIWRTLVIVAFI